MFLIEALSGFQLLILVSVIPPVFVFLWLLICGDVKNFISSRKGYTVYTAKDPINCYQDFHKNQKKVD